MEERVLFTVTYTKRDGPSTMVTLNVIMDHNYGFENGPGTFPESLTCYSLWVIDFCIFPPPPWDVNLYKSTQVLEGGFTYNVVPTDKKQHNFSES